MGDWLLVGVYATLLLQLAVTFLWFLRWRDDH